MNSTPAEKMLAAVGSSRYWVLLRQWRSDGTEIMQPHIGPLPVDEILARWKQWQRRNAARADILIRVADDPPPAVLVDDLDASSLRRLRSELQVSAVVETSPGNYQAWVPAPGGVDALAWSRGLQRRYDGDPGGVGRSQPGRLPSLCNRKPCRARADGRGPWVMLRHCDPAAQAAGPDFQAAVLGPRAAAAAAAECHEVAVPSAARRPPAAEGARSASEADWALARRMLVAGASVDAVEQRILELATQRGKRTPQQYARRTARKAAGVTA